MSDWKTATTGTITRLRAIWEMAPSLPEGRRELLMQEARLLTVAMGGAMGSRFWSVYLNTLRTLVAAEAEELPDQSVLFGANEGISDEVERAFKARGIEMRETARRRRN